MGVDLLILAVVLLFGLLGAATGVAAQLAQIAGMVVAFFCARPLARWLGPRLSASLDLPLAFGEILTTVVVFIVLLVAVRIITTSALRRLMAGKDPHDRSLDRTLGMVFAATKVIALSYLVVSGLAFVEQHVVIAGRKVGLSPKDSYAFKFARTYNLFEMTQFAPVHDLAEIARSVREGDHSKLEQNPAFRSLRADPRFQQVMADPELQRAFQAGDFQTLLRNNAVMKLIQDRALAARLAAAARDAE